MAEKARPEVAAAIEAQEKYKAQQAAKEEAASKEDGFEIFGAAPEVWTLSGSKERKYQFEIGPLRMNQIAAMVPLLGVLQDPLTEMFKTGAVNVSALQRLDAASLMECVAVATNQTPEAVADLTAEDFFRVCTKVLVVNGDFFVRTLPRVAGGAAVAIMRLVTAMPGTGGPSPSSDSSKPATETSASTH